MTKYIAGQHMPETATCHTDRGGQPSSPVCRHLRRLSLWTLLLSVYAPAGFSEDLLAVYKLAIGEDADYGAAIAARDAALERKPQSRALLLPKLDITGEVTRDRFHPREATSTGLFGATTTKTSHATNQTYTLELRQAIYQRDRFQQLELADHDVAMAVATYTAAEQDLVLRVAEHYFNLLAAQDNLEFVGSNKRAIAESLEQARHRYDVGLAAPTDLYEAQARFDIAVSDELNADKQLSDAREALFGITGTIIQQADPLQSEIPLLRPDPADPEQWVELSSQQSPALQAARESTRSAMQGIQVQRSGHYPSLDLIARYQYRDNDFGGFGLPIKRNDSAIGLQMTVPLYQGGLISSRSREAARLYSQAREIEIGKQRETELQTRESFRGVEVELSRIKALKQAIVSSEKALEASRNGYTVGTRNITDVLDAQRELLRTQRDNDRSRYDYLLNTLRLKRAAGSLSADDLEAINGYLHHDG